jgi:hypothetical protein
VVIPFGPVLRTGAAVLVIGLCAGSVHANPASLVPSAADPDDPADLHIRVDYEYVYDRATLYREGVGEDVDPLAPLPKHKDLAFKQFSHLITPRAELGAFHDTWLSIALPIVVEQERELRLAGGIDRGGSSTLIDGLLPMEGFDAKDPGTPPPGDLVFRGISRKGLDQLHLGLNVAPMSQDRDDTKPTWKLGAEVRLAVGRVMRFDAMSPGSETGVGKGVHELRLMTSVDKRYAHTESWFELFWQVPLDVKDASLFKDPGFGATNVTLGQQAGVHFGVETFFVDDSVNKISLDLGGRFGAHFEGRDYTELWEVFAYAGDARLGGPLVLDGDPTAVDVQAQSHPGITNFENYLEMAGRIAVRAQLGQYVRFAAMVDLVWKTDHVITFADAGVDFATCNGSNAPRCEDDENTLVNPGTAEVNPLHVQRVDLVGHRYHSEDNFGFVIGVEGQVLF